MAEEEEEEEKEEDVIGAYPYQYLPKLPVEIRREN